MSDDIIYVRGEAGSVFALGLPLHETIEHKLRAGLVHRCNEDGSDYTGEPDEVPGLPTSKPAANAAKAEWVGWAVVQGEDPEDAAAMTKQDIVEKHG